MQNGTKPSDCCTPAAGTIPHKHDGVEKQGQGEALRGPHQPPGHCARAAPNLTSWYMQTRPQHELFGQEGTPTLSLQLTLTPTSRQRCTFPTSPLLAASSTPSCGCFCPPLELYARLAVELYALLVEVFALLGTF
jgi:hypothetical protein